MGIVFISLFRLLVFAAIVGGLAIGAVVALEALAPGKGWKLRAIWAALFGGYVPALVPLGALIAEEGLSREGTIAILSLLVGGLIFAVLLGFPAAYFFARGREAKRNPASPADTFE